MGFGNPFDNLMFSVFPFIMFIFFAIFIMVFVTSLVKGAGQYFKNSSTPERTIPARLISKRTHTWGGHGNMSAHTSYYATFETEDGERMELPVGGVFSGMHVEGDTGILTHRGTRFIDFQREQR